MERRSRKFKVSLIATIILFSLSIVLLIPSMIFAATDTTDTTTSTTAVITPSIKFDVQFPEIKAKAGVAFVFNADLLYEGKDPETFDLVTTGPQGWDIAIAPSYQDSIISAIKMTPDKKETLKITATPLVTQVPGSYDITITAKNDDLKLEDKTTLKATITSTYDFTLTSKTGMLNTKATSGKNNPFIIVLTSTGSADIENLALKADAPDKWIVIFNPDKIETFKAADTKEITVTITPPDKTIAGDYMLNFAANSTDSSKNIDVRVTVETPSIWGWVGVGIIVIVVVGVAIVFARLGRR